IIRRPPGGRTENGLYVDWPRRWGLPVTVLSAPRHDGGAGRRDLDASGEYLNDPATPLFNLRRTEISGDCSRLRFELALWTGTTRPRSRRPMLEARTAGSFYRGGSMATTALGRGPRSARSSKEE